MPEHNPCHPAVLQVSPPSPRTYRLIEESPPPRRETISLTILAGFLGAGKTTLLNALVRAEHGAKLGVIVNDFGDINIDAELVAQVDGETLTLTNGCVCCTIKDDLLATLFRLLHRPDPPQHVLLECSGLSDPAQVLRSFAEASLFEVVQICSLVVVVDAEQFATVEFRDQPLALHQLMVADIVVLSKTDLVPNEVESVEARIRAVLPNARILRSVQGNVPFDLLLGMGGFDLNRLLELPEHTAQPGHGFTSWSNHWHSAADPNRLRDTLENLPAAVIRAKGIFALRGERQETIVQVVGRRIELQRGPLWESDIARRSKFVAIVEDNPGGEMCKNALTSSFAACFSDLSRPVKTEKKQWLSRFFRRASQKSPKNH